MANKRYWGKQHNKNPQWVRFALAAGVVLAIWGGFWLYGALSEVGIMGILPNGTSPATQSRVRLQDQPVYKIKKKQELLGVQVVRIISKQQPEEFLVLDGVSRKLVDRVYGKKPDLVWTNLMANQLLKLRRPGDGEASPVSVEVQAVKSIASGEMTYQQQKMPYWQLEVQFKLSNEDAPRFYEAGIVRTTAIPQATSAEEAQDTLVVGYAQKEAFQKELVADLMNHLSFEQN